MNFHYRLSFINTYSMVLLILSIMISSNFIKNNNENELNCSCPVILNYIL